MLASAVAMVMVLSLHYIQQQGRRNGSVEVVSCLSTKSVDLSALHGRVLLK